MEQVDLVLGLIPADFGTISHKFPESYRDIRQSARYQTMITNPWYTREKPENINRPPHESGIHFIDLLG